MPALLAGAISRRRSPSIEPCGNFQMAPVQTKRDKNRLTDQQRPKRKAGRRIHRRAARRRNRAIRRLGNSDTSKKCAALDAARDDARRIELPRRRHIGRGRGHEYRKHHQTHGGNGASRFKRASNAATKRAPPTSIALKKNGRSGEEGRQKRRRALVKWTKRILVACGGAAQGAGIGAVIAKLMVTYPQIGECFAPLSI